MKAQFNKYEFLRDLKKELEEYEGDRDECINNAIDTACIYTSDCFDICKALQANDFTAFDSDNVSTLAFLALRDFVYNKLD